MGTGVLEKILAACGLLACVVLMWRLWAGPARFHLALQRLRSLPQWRQQRATARREAEDAIARARRAGSAVDREGNVYKPRAFNDSQRKKPPLH